MGKVTLQMGAIFFTLAGQGLMSTVHCVNTCFVLNVYRTCLGDCRQSKYETPFSSLARKSVSLFGPKFSCAILGWMLCVGRARHPGPTKKPHANGDLHIGIKVLNVCGWLTHGDAALVTDSDFLLIAENRNECAALHGKI